MWKQLRLLSSLAWFRQWLGILLFNVLIMRCLPEINYFTVLLFYCFTEYFSNFFHCLETKHNFWKIVFLTILCLIALLWICVLKDFLPEAKFVFHIQVRKRALFVFLKQRECYCIYSKYKCILICNLELVQNFFFSSKNMVEQIGPDTNGAFLKSQMRIPINC